MEKLKCSNCSKDKTLDSFYKNKDKYSSMCIKCMNEYHNSSKNYKRTTLINEKLCPGCKIIKPIDNFSSNKMNLNGLQTYCKKCAKEKIIDKNIKLSVFEKFVPHLFKQCKTNADTREIKFEITEKDIYDLYEKQNGKCAYTNLELKFIINDPHSMSIDRINSDKDYTIDNIQLVCSIINKMKWTLKHEDFINLAKAVTKRKKEKENKEKENQEKENQEKIKN